MRLKCLLTLAAVLRTDNGELDEADARINQVIAKGAWSRGAEVRC